MSKQEHRWNAPALTVLFVCALVAAGCGGSNDTTTTTSTGGTAQQRNAQKKIDAAIKSCSDQADQLGGTAGTALANACTYIGGGAKQTAASSSENVRQTLSKLAKNCRNAVGQLPKGQAQDALSQFCDAIASAG